MAEFQNKTYTINIGTSDFKKLVTESTLYVDKTLLIKTIIEDAYDVLLITRPRRWGKTLNMSMLEYFFSTPVKENGDIDEEERSKRNTLFSHMKIGASPEVLQNHLGKMPTIFVSFKGIKGGTYEKIEGALRDVVYRTYAKHEYLRNSGHLSERQKDLFKKFITKEFDLAELQTSLFYLSEMLHTHFGRKALILIDEYDTPLNDWYALQLAREDCFSQEENIHYQSVLELFREFLGETLKDNIYLEKGVVTGILRVAKASLFSGVNNLGEDSVLDKRYAPHFGFTEEDVNSLLYKSGMDQNPETAHALKSWYNGYSIGGLTIYNPWSIMNCINNDGEFKAYWVGTASTALIERALILDKFQTEIQTLIEGGSVEMRADPKMVFADIKSSPNALYNLLLFSGYLTAEKVKQALDGVTYVCRVKIPNREVRGVFMTSVVQWVESKFKADSREYRAFVGDLLSGDVPKFTTILKSYLEASASYFDSGPKQAELLYNGFMWGLFASSVNEDYFVEKERETGSGRADLLIIPKEGSPHAIAFILEYKIASKDENLEAVAKAALGQIETKAYASKIKAYKNVKKTISIGLAFSGKQVEVVFRESP
ncbi:MAG TPA: AAA family ATPase [Alphaproteobacteria bacterium]|nr:AAA family ATPase [Alphaproteobacteria bacterium]